MATYAANLSFRIPFHSQYRRFSITWINKYNAVLCLKGRDSSSGSSAPFRYIPKKYPNSKDLENSPPPKSSDKDEIPCMPKRSSINKNPQKSPPFRSLDKDENNRNAFGIEGTNDARGDQGESSQYQSRSPISTPVFSSTPTKFSNRKNSENSLPFGSLDKDENDHCLNINAFGIEANQDRNDDRTVPQERSQYQNPITAPVFMNIAKKSSTSKIPEISTPLKSLDKDENDHCLNRNVLGIEANEDGKSGCRNTFLHERSWDQNQRSITTPVFDGNSDLEHNVMEEPEEVVDEFKFKQGLDCYQPDVYEAREEKLHVAKVAIGLLAKRAFTVVELRKKLHAKKFSSDIIEAVLRDFKRRGLINDTFYAETFSQSRWSTSTWGPRRIKQALFQKGVSEVDAQKALKVVFQDGESDEDEGSRLGMSKLSMDQLYVQASKQWLRGRDVPNETRKSRLVRWLQYRGFNWGVINSILKKLEAQYSP